MTDVLQDQKPSSSGYCECDGGRARLFYELWGEHHQEKLILIQGAFCTRRVFGCIGRIVSRDCAVLMFDNRGLGNSTAAHRWENPSSDDIAGDAETLIQHVWPGKAVHVAGASMGGMAAQKLALSLHTQRRLKSLTLMVTTLSWPYKIVIPLWAWRIYAWWSLAKPPRSMVPWLMKVMLCPDEVAASVTDHQGQPCTFGDQIKHAWLDQYDDWYCLRNSKTTAAHLHALFTHFIADGAVSTLRTCGVPILVVVATQDRLVAPQHQYAVARRMQASLLEVPTGHMMATCSDVVAASISAMIAGRPEPVPGGKAGGVGKGADEAALNTGLLAQMRLMLGPSW